MKQKLVNVAVWFQSDPQRVKVATLVVAGALALAAFIAPDQVAFAGPVPGGNDGGGG